MGGAERQNSKGVGGFLQLFDWNSKSRKKLFPNKSDTPEKSKQGKRSDRSVPITRYDQVDEDESRANSSVKGSSEYSCTSSVVDDDGYGGVQAPSVVARLMGLDSMPTSNCSEPSSTPFFDAQSLRSSHNRRERMEFERDNQMFYSGELNAEGQSRSTYDSKLRKIPSRPVEKFQSEVLPPRSAKSISITQHKLLSPIKSSGMFFTGDAAYIMEAAAKIIESGAQAVGKNKMPLVGSSSLPLKVRDLKEKVRATQERPELGHSFAPFRIREKDKIDAVQEKTSFGYSLTSFGMRDKERVDARGEKTSVGYSSVCFKTKDKVEEKTSAGYASSSFRMRDKARVAIADEGLEFGCNSGSFRARDKERPEAPPKLSRPSQASEKPVESSAAKYLKGHAMNKSWNGSRDTLAFGATSEAEVASNSNKGKSVSLAIQAKVNVQKREGMIFDHPRTSAGMKEQTEVKTQPSTAKNTHKRSSTQNASGVLRQNNQRQNSATDKGVSSKTSISNSQGKKVLTEDCSSTQHKKTASKTMGSSRARKMNMEAKNSESHQLNSVKNVPRKKRNIGGGLMFEGNQTADSGLNKSLKSEAIMDRCAWIEDSRKKGMDVVSFTFTSPMTRPTSGFNSPSQMAQRTGDLFPNNLGKKLVHDSESKISPSHGLNVIGSDALSLLLEQKLRELTTGIGPSSRDNVKSGSVPNFMSNIPSQDADSTTSKSKENPGLDTNRFCYRFDSGFQIDPLLLRNVHKLQVADEMDACSSNHAEAKNLRDCHLPSPVSILEGSFSAESCNSSRTTDSGMEDSEPCSSVQAREVIGRLGHSKGFYQIEADLSDSASSISPGIFTNTSQPAAKWELNYVKDLLSNVDTMFEKFSVGVTPSILNPQLFEELEICRGWTESDYNPSKLERKLYFDCVGENLNLRCRRYVGGGCEAWSNGMSMVKRKDRLIEEVYKEISGLAGMADCMVDELVDKDMSSQLGKWLNFEAEEFSLGVEIEVQILNSLVDEMVGQFLSGPSNRESFKKNSKAKGFGNNFHSTIDTAQVKTSLSASLLCTPEFYEGLHEKALNWEL